MKYRPLRSIIFIFFFPLAGCTTPYNDVDNTFYNFVQSYENYQKDSPSTSESTKYSFVRNKDGIFECKSFPTTVKIQKKIRYTTAALLVVNGNTMNISNLDQFVVPENAKVNIGNWCKVEIRTNVYLYYRRIFLQ